MHILRNGDWLAARAGSDLVLMNADTGTCFGLTETAGRIWELLEEPADLDTLCDKLAREYEASPEQIRADAEEMLRSLAQYGAIAFASP